MEPHSESYEEVKVKVMEQEVKEEEEEEVFLSPTDQTLESSKEDVRRIPANGGSRSIPMAASGPNGVTPAPDQLTIFYGGSVVVFDGIPAEKVREIMLIAAAAAAAVKPSDVKKAAASGSPAANSPILSRSPSLQNAARPAGNSPILLRSPSLQSATGVLPSSQTQQYPIHQGSALCKLQSELPIARRHSLQRFFEKRRDRLGSKSPYPIPLAEKKAETTKPDFSGEVSADEDCFERSAVPEAAAANVA